MKNRYFLPDWEMVEFDGDGRPMRKPYDGYDWTEWGARHRRTKSAYSRAAERSTPIQTGERGSALRMHGIRDGLMRGMRRTRRSTCGQASDFRNCSNQDASLRDKFTEATLLRCAADLRRHFLGERHGLLHRPQGH